MASKRKLWATSFPQIVSDRKRHPSEAAVYRWLHGAAFDWRHGALRSQHVTVWVDTREGFGWQRYELIDLAEFGGEGQTK